MKKEEIEQLAKLLVDYHNMITKENASVYGETMDKALCRDTFTTLFCHSDYHKLSEIQKGFKIDEKKGS